MLILMISIFSWVTDGSRFCAHLFFRGGFTPKNILHFKFRSLIRILENSDQDPENSDCALGELQSCLRRIAIESPENCDPGPGEPRSWPGEPVYAHRARGRAQWVVIGKKIIMAAMSVDLLLHFKANLSSCWTVSLDAKKKKTINWNLTKFNLKWWLYHGSG